MHRVFVILGCLVVLTACALGNQQSVDAPTVCSIRANPAGYADQQVTIRVVHLTDYFEFASLGDRACPATTLSLAGGRAPTGEAELLAAHCSTRIEQGDLVEFTARGIVRYDPTEAISTTFSLLEASEIRYVPAGSFQSRAVRDPRSRTWLCPNLLLGSRQ